jgi:DNA-directed RNA polymerase sigma subunit (sigma70/sigma32)
MRLNEGYRFAMSLQEIADVMGITKQRVDQLEKSALRKLRASGLFEEWVDWEAHLKRTYFDGV